MLPWAVYSKKHFLLPRRESADPKSTRCDRGGDTIGGESEKSMTVGPPAHRYLGLVFDCPFPAGAYSENLPEFSSLFPPVAEDGVPRTARSMSLTLGKVCVFKEYQGSQRKYNGRSTVTQESIHS